MKHTGELLEHWAREAGDRLALLEPGGRQHSFASLHDRVRRLAAALRQQGLAPGHRIVLLLPMGIDLYEVLLAVFHAGATAVLVDPQAGLTHMSDCLSRIGVHGLIGVPKAHLLRLRVSALRGGVIYASTGLTFPLANRLHKLSAEPCPRFSPPQGEPALVTFTTGTSGMPKAIGRTHAFLLAQHNVLKTHMHLAAGDIDLPTLPVFLLNSLAAGATCILPDGDLRDVSKLDPGRVAAQIFSHNITTISGSPAFFEPIVAHLLDRQTSAPTVKKVFVGGARVRSQLLQQMVQALPNARIEVLYGSTEAEPMASVDAQTVLTETQAREEAGEGTCVGSAVPGLAVRIADPDQRIDTASGEVGEIWVAGDHVNTHYYKDPDSDAANKVREGDRIWHRTGDAAWQDTQGRLWLVGRVTDRVAGRFPFQVEAIAEAFEGVNRAALMELAGQAVVVFEGSAKPEAVATATATQRAIRIERIPTDARHRAKIDRAALAELLRGR